MLTLISFLLYIFRSMLIGLTAGTIYIEYRVFKKMSAPTCIAVGLASTPMYISLLNYLLGLIFVGWPSLFFLFCTDCSLPCISSLSQPLAKNDCCASARPAMDTKSAPALWQMVDSRYISSRGNCLCVLPAFQIPRADVVPFRPCAERFSHRFLFLPGLSYFAGFLDCPAFISAKVFFSKLICAYWLHIGWLFLCVWPSDERSSLCIQF